MNHKNNVAKMTSIQLTVWKDMFNIIWTKNKDSDGVTVAE